MEYSVYHYSGKLIEVFGTIEGAYSFCNQLHTLKSYQVKELNIEAEEYVWVEAQRFVYHYENHGITDLSLFIIH